MRLTYHRLRDEKPVFKRHPSGSFPARALVSAIWLATLCGASCGGGNSNSAPLPAFLSLNPASLNFGNQAVGTTSIPLSVTLTNTGSESLTISSATMTGTGFNMQGLSLPLTLAAGEISTVDVTFSPSALGAVTGSISFTSTATNSPTTESLSGQGVHAVELGLLPSSTDGVIGYNIYRGNAATGPFGTKLNAEPIATLTYTDYTVQGGQTYFYVATAVAWDGVTESPYSNVVSATVPSP